MDRRSWLWRRKSSEKSPGETESSGSVSSISERFSDDQEVLRSSPVCASPNNAQSPDILSKVVNNEIDETVRSLNEKLTAALFNIAAKEDLVKQHSKVAEEAVAGWEKAENEVASLKKQLEATNQKNSALDGALKECVRQFRQSREEQEQKLNDILSKKTDEWRSQKIELETRITELQSQLGVNSDYTGLHLRLQALEKENSTLIVERELSTEAAELASKQHLESIKKVAKLEAECRKLRASMKKSSPFKDNDKNLSNPVYVESIADNQSDCCSESCASLIFELDHFKNDNKAFMINHTSTDIELMDDFLEMEKLAALPKCDKKEKSSMEEKIEKMAIEKTEVEMALAKTQDKLMVAEDKLADLQRQLNSTNGSKRSIEIEMEAMELKKKELESQLKAKNFEIKRLHEKVGLLETKCQDTNALVLKRDQLEAQLNAKTAEAKKLHEKVGLLKIKCRGMDDLVLKREQSEAQLESAYQEIKKLNEKIGMLERNIEDEKNIYLKLEASCKKIEVNEAEKIGLESKLISSQLETEELQGRISSLERKLSEHMILSLEFESKANTLEGEKEALKSQLESAHYELHKAREKLCILEKEIGIERESSSELTIKCINFEALIKAKIEEQESQVKEKRALNSQVELANLEAEKLREKLEFMEKEIENERKVSEEFAIKCGSLKEEIAILKQEMESNKPASLIEERKLVQEEEYAVASGKFAECQKTIASISSQLRLLKDFNIMLEEPELDNKENLIESSLTNYQEKALRPTSASASLNMIESLSSNRKCI